MKFFSEKDKKLFEISYDDIDDFYRKVMSLKKSFRRSQLQKHNWRAYRSSYMRGIKAFHRSTAGKRFHRWLAQYLAYKYRPGYHFQYKKEEAIKALSSIITHLAIESEYYHPLLEHVEVLTMMEIGSDWISGLIQDIVEMDSDSAQDIVPQDIVISEEIDAKILGLALTYTDPSVYLKEIGKEIEDTAQFYSDEVFEWPKILEVE